MVLRKGRDESEQHVLLKALVFALYADRYPGLAVEVSVGHRYKPDLVALDDEGRPLLWAECGQTGRDKIAHLLRRLPDTHLVFAKQATRLDPLEQIIHQGWPNRGRTGPVELLSFPADAAHHLEAAALTPCQPEERVMFGGSNALVRSDYGRKAGEASRSGVAI